MEMLLCIRGYSSNLVGVLGGDNVDAVDTVAWDACLFIGLPDIVLLPIHIQTRSPVY